VAGVLVLMRTPPRSQITPRVAAANASIISSIVTPVKPVESLSSGAARLPGVIEAENKFVAELVDSFYKRLKRSIALVLKGLTTSFSALKVVLSRSIDSIWDFGGDDQATTLELLVDRLERDARLEQLKAQNNEVLQQEPAQRAILVEIEARLT